MQSIPLGIVGAAAATPLAQRPGETDQLQHGAAAQARQSAGEKQAENASGIGQTNQDEAAGDRDADGRRIWERSPDSKNEADDSEPADAHTQAKDLTGQTGSQLDLSG